MLVSCNAEDRTSSSAAVARPKDLYGERRQRDWMYRTWYLSLSPSGGTSSTRQTMPPMTFAGEGRSPGSDQVITREKSAEREGSRTCW